MFFSLIQHYIHDYKFQNQRTISTDNPHKDSKLSDGYVVQQR